MDMQSPNVHDRTTREAEQTGPAPHQRELRLGDAQRRIAALTKHAPDDLARSSNQDPKALAGELALLAQELTEAHEQLRRQTTELAYARELLESERERFRELFEVAPEGHVITDPTGAIQEANRRAAGLLNIPVDYLVGKPLAVFVDSSERRAFRVRVYRARVEGAEEAWTTTLHPRDGEPTRTFVAVSPLLNARGTVVGLRWLLRDVSNQRAGAVWDRTPVAVLRSAIDALSTHVAVVDVDGTIVTMNRAWRDATSPGGVLARASAGANYLDLCANAVDNGFVDALGVWNTVLRVLDGHDLNADAVYSDRRSHQTDAELIGRESWFALRVTRCDGPEPAMIVVTHEDITAERRAHARETALITERSARAAAEAASRAKSEFLATLSHELRTPLNAIAGYAQLLEMGVRGPITREQGEDLRRILRSEQHLLGLINELLNFARIERGELAVERSPVILADAVEEVLELVEPQAVRKSLTVSIECAQRDLVVMSDAEKLRQILLNLLTNAVKFTPMGGSIRVECNADVTRVRIAVHDTGIGIALAKQEQVFDPFVQVDRGPGSPSEGIGLGLAISRSLARAMGGDVTVRSEPGKGSTFELSLARATADVSLS